MQSDDGRSSSQRQPPTGRRSPDSPRVEIRLLGRFSVRRGGDEIENERFGGRLPRRLVRILATRLDEVVTRDSLIDILWPHRLPADPDNNLSVLMARARRALAEPSALSTAPGGYRLCAAPCWVDVVEFRRRIADGLAEVDGGRPATALRYFLAALDLWGEPLPEDSYQEWVQPVRQSLLSDYQGLLEEAADVALLVNQPVQAASLAQRAVAEEPLRERAHLLLARALVSSGARGAALAALGNLRRTLADELGVDPSPEAVDIERRILRGGVSHPEERPISGQAPRQSPFIGRRVELDRLLAVVAARRFACIRGGAGSGKSRLLEELGRQVAVPVLMTRAFLPEAATPWALARSVLREALGHDVDAPDRLPSAALHALGELVLPELAVDVADLPVRLEQGTRRTLALEAAVRLLISAAKGGAVLVVDDLQWADATSLELLALVVSRVETLTVVVAQRPVTKHGDAAAFLAQVDQITDTVHVELGRLSVEEITELTHDRQLAVLLDEETDGRPFAVLEVLRSLSTNGAAAGGPEASPPRRQDGAGRYAEARQVARDGQRHSVLARVAAQGPSAREVLQLMAVLGREASAALLARALGRPQNFLLDALDRLAGEDLVRLGDRGWATAHDLIAETVFESLERADRGRLHLLLANALEEGGDPGERAEHLRSAGDPRAPSVFAQAAREQLARRAHAEAERLAQAGLDTAVDEETRSRLLAVRAESRAHRGDLSDARDDLREALALTRDRRHRSRLLARSAAISVATDDLGQAGQLVELALLDAASDPRTRAQALAVGSIVDMNGPDRSRAERRAAEALELYEELGDEEGVADILDARAMASFLDGGIRQAVGSLDRVARLFADSGNLLRVVTPRSTRGHALVFLDDPATGLAEIEVALDVADTLGHRDSQAFALWHRSEALGALGRLDGAMDSAARALALAEEVGHRGWTATAWRAIGLVHEAREEDEEALAAYRQSLQAGHSVPLFACWADARLSLTWGRLGDRERAARHAQRAREEGPPLGQYEARLAEAAAAVDRGDKAASELVAVARERATAGGHLMSVRALATLVH